jgi:hypothetical protein
VLNIVLNGETLKVNYHYPGWAKWAFAHVPFLMYAYRSFMMITVYLRDFRYWQKLTSSIQGDLLWGIFLANSPVSAVFKKVMSAALFIDISNGH